MPSPLLENGTFSKSALRGQQVFNKAGCSDCHSGPYYTNGKQYDLLMGKNLDAGLEFDVPTLIECWRTAPYLYDGRAATMRDVLTTHNEDDQHGKTSNLGEQEIEDLIAYVLSL